MERQAWPEAANAYRYGLDAAESLIEAQVTDEHKRTVIRAVQNLPQRAAYALAKVGDAHQGALVLEHETAHLMDDMVERRRISTSITSRLRGKATSWSGTEPRLIGSAV